MKSVLHLAFFGAVLWLAPSASAGVFSANEAVDRTGGNGFQLTAAGTFGWSFTVNKPMELSDLAVWSQGPLRPHEVGLWSSTGMLLRSSLVTGFGYALDPMGQWLISGNDNPHVRLAVGETYTIGAQFAVDDLLWVPGVDGTILVRPSEITLGPSLYTIGSGLNMPTTIDPANSLGANFYFSEVPEPGTFALVGAALAACIGIRRRRSSNSNLQT